ncbi:MAG: iron complex outermembrane receptor protein [Celeribacter sp.]|jgi:iron complex outermembrane receptor protein
MSQEQQHLTQGYTLADLKVSYDMSDFSVDRGVTNLFDKDYYSVCYDGYGCSKGEGRVISLSLSREF